MNAQLIQETIDRLKYERDLTSGGIVSNAYTIIEPMQFITIMNALQEMQNKGAEMTDKIPEQSISTCPRCGGYADNGFDRCSPPNPYVCSKCERADLVPAAPRPTDAERQAAERAYATTAFDFERDPIGSSSWVEFWDGWQARMRTPAVTDDARKAALEWFEDLVTCSKLVSGQEPQARYIRAGILSGFYEVPSFGVDYLFNNTCSGLSLFDSKDGGDSKTMESHVRARFLQLLNWIAYNYPKGIKVVK